jgi:hypothetical protein
MQTQKFTCPECGQPCSLKQFDDGIGFYEYWGQKCRQSNPYLGSDCCGEFIQELEELPEREIDREDGEDT